MQSIKNISKEFIRLSSTLRAIAFVTYKEWAAYRSHMLVSILVGPVFFIIQVFIWRAVYSTRGSINGLTLQQMITYYGIVTVIEFIIMDFAGWNLQMLIRTGRFLTFMLRPVSHRFFAFSQKIGHRALGFALEFLPVYFIFVFVFKVPLVPRFPFWAVLSILLSFVINFLINYSIGITGFWFTRTGGVRQMFVIMKQIFAGVFIPLSFFPMTIQKFLFFLPFQFVTYVPIRVFIGSYELGGISLSIPQIVGLQFITVFIMILVSEVLWRLGIRKFTGVGA